MKNYFQVLLPIVLFSFILFGCTKDDLEKSTETFLEKDELVLAIGGEPDDGFDPTTGWGRYGHPLFQSTLLSMDQNFQIKGDLAEDYQVSDDGFIWTVKIRQDAKFSDGEKVTADDVVFTYKTAKSNGSIVDLTNVNEIKKEDDYTVQFILAKPQSTFVYKLTSLGIVPEHAYGKKYNEKPIGSGPYKLVQWNKGQQLIVEENPYYYGKKPYFKKITFLFLSEDAAFAAAKSGQVDVVSVPATLGNETIAGMKLIALDSVDNRGIMFPFVPSGDTTEDGVPIGNDVTADIAIRKAINIGIDREKLVEGVLNGFGTPAFSVADQLPWWNEETVIEDNNMEEAKQILDEAGWKEQENGIRQKDGLEATFTLYYPAGDQIRQSLSMAIAEMVKPLGIKVATEGKSWAEIEKVMFSNPVMMGWGSMDPLEMYNLYSSHTKGIGYYNANYYSNPTSDQYMEKALAAKTQEEANMYWKKAQWDGSTGFSAKGDAPWAWLVNIQHLYFVREHLDIGKQKIQPHGHGWPITENITDWKWTKK